MQSETPRRARDRALLGIGIGNTLVWFDFALFGTVSGLVFPKLFFPSLSPFVGLLAAFLTFGVGLIARPIGALVLGNIGDQIGRKQMLVLSMILMSISSLGMGLLPGYHVIGVAAPILLVFLRVLQGFCLGGETSGSTVMALEYAPSRRRAFVVAVVAIGSPIGQLLVSLILVIVRATVDEAAFLAWAWRIPFLFGFGLAIVGFFIRRRVDETPIFRRAESTSGGSRPLVAVLRDHPKTIALLVPLAMSSAALHYVCTVFVLTYLKDTLDLPTQVGFTVLLVVNIFAIFLQLTGAFLSDRHGRKPVVSVAIVVALVGTLAYFPLVDTRSWPLILLASLLTIGALATAGGARTPLFAEPFPTRMRYSGHATAFTIGNVIGGSPAPFVAAGLMQWTGTTWSITAALAVLLLLALAVLPFIEETVNVDLERAS